MNAKPLRNNILVRQDDIREDVSPLGILVAASKQMVESQKQLGRRGTVTAIGPDVTEIKPGDRVLYGEFMHPNYWEGGRKYIRMQDADIVGVIEEES